MVTFDKHWHHLEGDEVAALLSVDPKAGLDQFETEQRSKRYGENVITGKRVKTPFERFMLQFHQPLVYILVVAGLVTAILGEWVDSSVIMAVVLVNALVGYFQEAKALKALQSLSASMRVEALVLRAGEQVRLPASALVPGDVVLLRSGDKVPADMRVFSERELRIDESTLTGESVPVEKNAAPSPKDAVLADRHCMAYAGTLVSYGQGRGVVVGTGNYTEIGRISGLIDSADELETPLTRKIAKFSHMLLIAILILAAVTMVLGLIRSEPLEEMFMAAVALAVGAIPEGLPAAVTIILAMGVSRMAGRKAVIRKLPAVETLGGTTVICSDKTGTLTENQMTVQSVYSGGTLFDVSGIGYGSEGEVTAREGVDARESQALAECLRAGLLCNDARIRSRDGQLYVEGDPTEGALVVAAAKLGMTLETEAPQRPRIDELPFESEWRYMATLHETGDGAVVYMKGAVEKILECCSGAMMADGSNGPLDADGIIEVQRTLAAQGLRVLALARNILPGKERLKREKACMGMEFLGLQGMIDPPREEAVKAVAACQKAGVKVKMITGDHALTAEAIGKMLGLRGTSCTLGEDCPILTGSDIAELSDKQLIERVADVPVFARVSPEQKLRLVMALQARGEVCAMTGDGVNDAPALKQADIGIAMGINGTEVAKEASDMILTDDNFATITAAVEEGRGVYANLIKFIAWTLPTNAGEGLVILTAILFQTALPILPVQILWINMTTAVCLGMTLAFEPKEPGIMDRPPHKPDRPILDRVVLRRIGMVSLMLLLFAFGLFKWELLSGASPEKARTIAVNVFVVIEAFYLFNARSFRRSPFELGLGTNLWVVGGFALMMVLQLLFTYLPFMNNLFSTAPIGLFDWVKIALCGMVVFLIVEYDKRRVGSDV
ncbi:HAD-IC family P-type ATPase [Pseudodesulfovibrio sp. F-1]|uniref:HAD-IC family P-type ATPase n=1 Tax=Pseudodesulfovibrio alkaliphilus TaxID=2661613 RepID=A0A7K1KPT3_9BACT|nr:cation-transporting P-type ATPase [Pseudodesulfovibrio alkaliphilus]MUM78087.1 HAD-IC family P-type ATPase [Pseudodesulfovibrio alkaliphilus]